MRKFATILSAVLLCGGSALAAQNVANTSQKGSLLIWPLIEIGANGETEDTLIEISNDGSRLVHIVCYYVNEQKDRRYFDFDLTARQTASWSVLTQDGDQVHPPAFPTGAGNPAYPPATGNYHPASPYRGELVCFATNRDQTAQIAHNHLTGTATVTEYEPPATEDPDSSTAFRYNAWSFVARNGAGLPAADRTVQGTPGRLDLTGNGAGTYDACPAYNIANFMPNGGYLGEVAGLRTIENELTVVSCNQDLRQDYDLYLTKLQFAIWNSWEESYSAFVCVDSVNTVELGGGNGYLNSGSNFDYSTLRTANARFQVRGVASTQCPGSVNSGLLGVLSSEVYVQPDGDDQEVGSTTQGAGVATGFVLWNPGSPDQFKPARR